MILISIYPEYVDEIKKGIKKYEFRKGFSKKRRSKLISQRYVAVYESMPRSFITLIFKIGKIYEDDIFNIWEKFGNQSGITKDYFFGYYHGRNRGVAIQIKDFFILKNPITLKEIRKNYPKFIPPQNFYQLSEEKYPLLYQKLKKEILRRKF